jgi:O-antigen ligase
MRPCDSELAHAQPALRLALGYGQDLQAAVLQGAVTRADAKTQFADRAHQLLLDSTLETGLLGSLLLLALLLLSLWRLRHEHARFFAVVTGLLCWQVSFALTAEKALLIILLCADARAVSDAQAAASKLRLRSLLAALTVAAFALFAFSTSLLPWNKSRAPEHAYLAFQAGQKAHAEGDLASAQTSFARASRLDPWRADMACAAQSYRKN